MLPNRVIIALAAGALCAGAAAQAQQQDIVETAVGAGSFKTLATALQRAELVEALQGDGPFTVFAPTDDAFAKLPKGTLEMLLQPENRGRLTAILTYHVAPGRLPAEQLIRSGRTSSMNGQRIGVATVNGRVTAAGAGVLQADIECTNGVIHVIDTVMMPATDDIVDVAASAGQFGTLIAAAQAAGLDDALRGDGPFTVLAPTDEAFAKLPSGTVKSLLEPGNKQQLAAILKYHVIPARAYSDQAITAGTVSTLQGSPLSFVVRNGRLVVNESNVIANDIDASNGVIHVIDTVLMPPAPPQPQGRLVIGVYTGTVGRALASQLGVDRKSALLITDVTGGGNAEKAGLQKYDVVTSIDRRPATEESLREAKTRQGPGGTLELSIIRQGKAMTIRVPVGIDRH